MMMSNDIYRRALFGAVVSIAAVCVIGAGLFIKLPGRGEASAQSASAAAHIYMSLNEEEIGGAAALVYGVTSGQVLFQKNAERQLPLASLTKLMLATVASETLPHDTYITISAQDLMREGDSGLVEGEVWRLQDLLDFTLMMSSNDGAQALARAVEEHTGMSAVDHMNQKAQELGLTQTYFTDPSGLDESETMASAYGSARDVAELMLYTITTIPEAVSATAKDSLSFTTSAGKHLAVNTNIAQGAIPGLIAGKTGFTDIAGGNLAVAFDISIGRPVIVIVLGSGFEGRFDDVKKLSEAARVALLAD